MQFPLVTNNIIATLFCFANIIVVENDVEEDNDITNEIDEEYHIVDLINDNINDEYKDFK